MKFLIRNRKAIVLIVGALIMAWGILNMEAIVALLGIGIAALSILRL